MWAPSGVPETKREMEDGNLLWPMNSFSLFIRVFDDLETKSASPDWYDRLQCARLLRLLLLESEPLLVSANRKERLKIRFEVNDIPLPSPALRRGLLFSMDTLDPQEAPKSKHIICTLDAFLGCPCILTENRQYTVREVILYQANTQGGVHFEGVPPAEREQLRALDIRFELMGQNAVLYTMAPIIRITLRSLRPLRDKLYGQLEKAPPWPPRGSHRRRGGSDLSGHPSGDRRPSPAEGNALKKTFSSRGFFHDDGPLWQLADAARAAARKARRAMDPWPRMPLSTTGLDATKSDILWGYVGVLAILLSAWVTLCLMFRVLLGKYLAHPLCQPHERPVRAGVFLGDARGSE